MVITVRWVMQTDKNEPTANSDRLRDTALLFFYYFAFFCFFFSALGRWAYGPVAGRGDGRPHEICSPPRIPAQP